MKRASTAYLITCAVLGVAGALVLAPANWAATFLAPTLPFVGIAIGGVWILPAVIALRLLRRPGAGLLVGLISGIVLIPLSGYGVSSIATNLYWSFFAELGFLVVGYRFWSVWQHYAGAAVLGIAYPLMTAVSWNLWTMPVFAQMLFFGLCLASVLLATFLGILIADRLAQAGVARAARRRQTPVTEPTGRVRGGTGAG